MSFPRRTLILLTLLAVPFAACSDADKPFEPAAADPGHDGPHFTVSSGSNSTLLGRTTFSPASEGPFKVKRMEGDWHVEIKALRGLDLAVQRIVFQPGAQSGWHRHPGPVFIQVVEGTINFYDSDDPTCTPITRTKGEGFLDTGDHAHIARNESGAVAENIVTYFAPPGAPLRIDAPAPGHCPF